MPSRQQTRAEETKGAILAAAGQLFAQHGFDAVTMREIAKAAGCSHTTIYIYFRDKEALLQQLAMGPLQALRQDLEAVLRNPELTPDERVKTVSRVFLRFGFSHRTIYTILFMAGATRVDVQEPATELNRLRNGLFGLLRQAVQECLPPEQPDELLWAYARIFFFTLHGILSLYAGSDEPFDLLMPRLTPTFELAADVILAGIKQTPNRGANLS